MELVLQLYSNLGMYQNPCSEQGWICIVEQDNPLAVQWCSWLEASRSSYHLSIAKSTC